MRNTLRLVALILASCLGGGQALSQVGGYPSLGPGVASALAKTLSINGGVVPSAANNADLNALPSTYSSYVIRAGFASVGDAPMALYRPQATCPYNGGVADGGACVATSDSKFWVAQFPATGADATIWGCPHDGVTDAHSCLNEAAAASPVCLLIPPTTSGFYLTSTFTYTGCVKGTNALPINASSSFAFPGQSWLKCNVGAAACVAVGTYNSTAYAPYLENLVISGGSGVPTSGAIGFQFLGGYNAQTHNVVIQNFDTCFQAGPGATYAPITIKNYGMNLGACKSHFVVDDGTPEVSFFEGRWGMNGTGDYTTTQDALEQTQSTNVGSGGGSNTVILDNVQINPTGALGCAFNWNKVTGTGGLIAETKITNVHLEWHSGFTGTLPNSETQGIFCSDSTVASIQQLQVGKMVSVSSVPLFSLNAATALQQAEFDNNTWGCTNITLTLPAVAAVANSGIHFSNNFGCSTTSFSGNTNQVLFSDHNLWGSLVVSGAWNQLASTGDWYGSLTDTATGNVSWSNPVAVSWTPVLNFGGAHVGLTYSVQTGNFKRNATGGYSANYSITLSNVGSSTGAASITGLPKNCNSGGSTSGLSGNSNTSGIGAGFLASVLSNQTIYLYYNGSAVQNSNFTNTSQIVGTVTCDATT